MRHRQLGAIGIILVSAMGAAVAVLSQGAGQISGIVVAAREDDAGNDSLLLKTPSTVGNTPVDEVLIETDNRTVENATPGKLPGGWILEKGRGVLRLSGPPLDPVDDLWIRFGLGGREAPDDLTLKLLSNDRTLYDRSHDIDRFPTLEFTDPTDDIVDLPGSVSPGERIEFTVRDIGRFSDYGLDTYGQWRIGASLAYEWPEDEAGGEETPTDTPAEGADPPARPMRYGLDLGYDLDSGLRLRVEFTSKWDEAFLELEEDAGPEIVPEPDVEPNAPWIITCSPKAFAGDTVCVCGWFPEDENRNGLMVDGQALGTAAGASNQTVRVTLPGDLSPGRHVITGSGVAGSAEITIISLGGSVDQEQLLRGESTPIRLWLEGTEDPTQITLRNRTPAIISLEGGDEQIITTAGGSDNAWEGMVRGISRGDFNLTYSLDLRSCPCGEEELTTVTGELTAETLFDETLRSFRRAREQADDAYDDDETDDADPRDTAQDALDELEQTKQKLQDGIDAWDRGDTEGGIGPTTAETFTRLITDLETRARTVIDRPVEVDDDDGEDPRDTPPPTIYGEEIDPPWISITDGSLSPSQGVWQDDDYFDDKATKQITRLGPTSWDAELDMVANRNTRVFGIKEDGHIRVKMSGATTYSRLAPVRFRFKLIQGGTETIIWTQREAENHILIDGPAGPVDDWATSLMTPEGVPKTFKMQPGTYTLKMELIRANGDSTGLEVTVTGNVVETSFPDVSIVPVLLSNAPAAAMHELSEDVRRLALSSELRLPRLFPLPKNGVTVTAQPIQDLSTQELDTVDRLISLLPGTDTSENVRRDRMVASMVQRFASSASLNGGGKVVIVMNDADFAMTDRRHEGIGGYAPHAKVLVLKMGNYATTVAHELIHSIPYSWADAGMQAECGFSYHNSNDNHYGNGVQIYNYSAFRRNGVDAVMGPVSAGAYITQCSYWHLLKLLQGAVDPDLYLVRGFVARRDGQSFGVLSPTYELEDTSELTPGALDENGWGIVLRDAAGQPLATYPFEVVWRDADANEDRAMLAFTHRVDRVPGTATIELVGPGGRKDVQTVSANAPTIAITSPTNGSVVDPSNGLVTIEWEAADADGDDLSYLVFYSPDGGQSWRPLADEQREPRFDLPIVGRPLGPRVRVIATDGVRSATAEVEFTLQRR